MSKISVSNYIRDDILQMQPYLAANSLWDLRKKYGTRKLIKLDSGESQLGCSPKALNALEKESLVNFYPDSEYKELRRALAKYAGVNVDSVIVGSGSDEVLDLLYRLVLNEGDKIINSPPTFGMYEALAQLNKGQIVSVPRLDNFALDIAGIQKVLDKRVKIIMVCSPNNPTGTTTSKSEILTLIRTGKLVIVDEAYFEFYGKTVAPLVSQYPNLIVVRTLSKWAGLAGLRLGYGIMNPYFVQQLLKIKPPYNVNSAAVAAGIATLQDPLWKKRVIQIIVDERERVKKELRKIPNFTVYDSSANLLYIKIKNNYESIKEYLAAQQIIVKYADAQQCIRLTIGSPAQNSAVISALKKFASDLQIGLIFDMDGVLIDVSQSYRQAIVLTANRLLGKQQVDQVDVDLIKSISGFNNDWDTTYALISLIKSKTKRSEWAKAASTLLPIIRKSKQYQMIYKIFQTYYLGSSLYENLYKLKAPFQYQNGLIANETCLINPILLEKVVSMGIKIGIATGRPKFEALEAIRIAKLTAFFNPKNIVALEDTKYEKPNPAPLLLAQKRISVSSSVYIGDTLNDKQAAKSATMTFYLITDKKSPKSFLNINRFLEWWIAKQSNSSIKI